MKDKNLSVRFSAAWALGEIGNKRGVEPLLEILKDRERLVRSSATKALKKITGKDFGTDYDKWKEWYEKTQE